jgi:formylmethanofuran dehydrogenase subunit B
MAAAAELKIVENATCTFCGCVCDDMELTVEDHRITKAKNACVLGKAWFLNHKVEERPGALIEGKPASLDEAVERATTCQSRCGRRSSRLIRRTRRF